MMKLLLLIIFVFVCGLVYNWINVNVSYEGIGFDKDLTFISTAKVDSSRTVVNSPYETTYLATPGTSRSSQIAGRKRVCQSDISRFYCIDKYKVMIRIKKGIAFKTKSDTIITVNDFDGETLYRYPTLLVGEDTLKTRIIKLWKERWK